MPKKCCFLATSACFRPSIHRFLVFRNLWIDGQAIVWIA